METMTKEKIIEDFRRIYDRLLRRYAHNVENYASLMNKDYEAFFRRRSGDMYVDVIKLNALRELRPAVSEEDPERIRVSLKRQIRAIELMLIEGDQYPTTIYPMDRAAEPLGRLAKQELRDDLKQLLEVVF